MTSTIKSKDTHSEVMVNVTLLYIILFYFLTDVLTCKQVAGQQGVNLTLYMQ